MQVQGGGAISEQLESFARANECHAPGGPIDAPIVVERTALSDVAFCDVASQCALERPVRGCGVEGLGHCWPQANGGGAGNAECLNQNPGNPDTSEYTLRFFSSLPGGSSRAGMAAALALAAPLVFVTACLVFWPSTRMRRQQHERTQAASLHESLWRPRSAASGRPSASQ